MRKHVSREVGTVEPCAQTYSAESQKLRAYMPGLSSEDLEMENYQNHRFPS